MTISFDPAKRKKTLADRGLDFADAERVIDGPKYQFVDDRFDYGEERVTTIGMLDERMVVVVWTQRDEGRHIISMRKANEREQRSYQTRMD
jgi:uncharacterized DUF497 family protein